MGRQEVTAGRWPEEAKGPGKFCVLFYSVLKLQEPERRRAAGTVAMSRDQDLRRRKGDTDRPPTVTGGTAACEDADVTEAGRTAGSWALRARAGKC